MLYLLIIINNLLGLNIIDELVPLLVVFVVELLVVFVVELLVVFVVELVPFKVEFNIVALSDS